MRYVYLILAIMITAGAAEARCYVTPWRTAWDVEGLAYAQSDGGPCVIKVDRAFGTGELHSIRVAEPSRHGTAVLAGFGVAYRPRAGFKGEDSFVFAVAGRENGNTRKSSVRVHVTVR